MSTQYKRTLSILLAFFVLLNSFIVYLPHSVYAEQPAESFFLKPNDLVNQLPQVGQNVPRLPNPTQGILPRLPAAGAGDPTPVQAPLERPNATPNVQEQPIEHHVDIATGFFKV